MNKDIRTLAETMRSIDDRTRGQIRDIANCMHDQHGRHATKRIQDYQELLIYIGLIANRLGLDFAEITEIHKKARLKASQAWLEAHHEFDSEEEDS